MKGLNDNEVFVIRLALIHLIDSKAYSDNLNKLAQSVLDKVEFETAPGKPGAVFPDPWKREERKTE